MPWHEVALKFKDTFAHNFSAASPNMTRVLTVGQVAAYEGLQRYLNIYNHARVLKLKVEFMVISRTTTYC